MRTKHNHPAALTFAITSLFVMALALSGCGGPSEQRPMIDIALDHPDGNSADMILSGDTLLIDVTDSRGINGLTARLVSGSWPEEIAVHLPLDGLEHLEIQYGNYTISTGRSSNDSPDPPLMLTVVDEQGQAQTASPSADIYYPDISRTADGFTITLPPHFFREDHEAFSLQWIDFYRN